MTFRDAVAAVVDTLVGPRLDMRAAYRCRVVTQHSDGTLDVAPESTRIPGMTRVPVVYGDAATRAKVKSGVTCYVEFADGDESKPIVRGFEPGAVTEITIDAERVRLADGGRPLARVGDLVAVTLPTNANSSANAWTPVPNPLPTARAYGIIVSGVDKVTAP
jgi:hypothetical protein